MKALVGAFNQEKALIGAFSVIVKIDCGTDGSFYSTNQDTTMGGTTPLETARRLIADQGADFRNAFATTPICCPSRASILTGRYQHNTGR